MPGAEDQSPVGRSDRSLSTARRAEPAASHYDASDNDQDDGHRGKPREVTPKPGASRSIRGLHSRVGRQPGRGRRSLRNQAMSNKADLTIKLVLGKPLTHRVPSSDSIGPGLGDGVPLPRKCPAARLLPPEQDQPNRSAPPPRAGGH